jgi:hypothetical protein
MPTSHTRISTTHSLSMDKQNALVQKIEQTLNCDPMLQAFSENMCKAAMSPHRQKDFLNLEFKKALANLVLFVLRSNLMLSIIGGGS